MQGLAPSRFIATYAYLCSMESGKLDKDYIQQSELWRLALQTSDNRLDIALYPPVESEKLITRTIMLDPANSDRLKALEECVYANPLLLNDFKRIDCVIDSDCFMAIPTAIADADLRRKLFETSYPAFDGEIMECPLGCPNATLLLGVDPALAGFIRRTFYGVRFTHVLSPLCRYFASVMTAQRLHRATFVSMRRDKTDVIIIDDGRLMLANTFSFVQPADAAYYILASRSQLECANTEPILVYGSGAVTNEVTDILGRYAADVTNVSQPAGPFRADQSTSEAPTNLRVMPLCE